jgi:hypothetical protein
MSREIGSHNNVLSVAEARKKFSRISEILKTDKKVGSVTVTKWGKPVLDIVDWELFEAITETLEIMVDKNRYKALMGNQKQANCKELISTVGTLPEYRHLVHVGLCGRHARGLVMVSRYTHDGVFS